MNKLGEAYLVIEEMIDTRTVEPLRGVPLSTLLAASLVQVLAFVLLLCTTAKGRTWVSKLLHETLSPPSQLQLTDLGLTPSIRTSPQGDGFFAAKEALPHLLYAVLI
jgi:hypothetical protein